DGTLSPWAVASSLPFAPEIVVPTLRHMEARYPKLRSEYGYLCSFNPTCREGRGSWVAPDYLGLDQGPIVGMIENARTGFVWDLMRRTPEIRNGLLRAGFRGGWLGEKPRQRKAPGSRKVPAPA
ncbi:MAG TPA: glucoamylase family protein, partial [Thermoanaerobaculia bacterium]